MMVKCEWCDRALSTEEERNPLKSRDDQIICDDCYDDEYRLICPLCMDSFDKTEEPGDNYFFLIGQELTGSECIGPYLPIGIYQITEFPFFADGLIEGHFYSSAFKLIRCLDNEELESVKDLRCKNGEVCQDCAKKHSKNNQI